MFVGIYFVICALSSLQLINGATTKNDDSNIVFPGPVQGVSNRLGTADVPEECKDKNFCTVKPADYPQELFNRMFKGKFKEPAFQPTYVMTDDRFRDPEDEDNCETHVTYEPLYNVKTNDGNWRTVVQAPEENFIQMCALCSLQLTNGASSNNDDSNIVFPGPIQNVSNRYGAADVPEECKDKNFCTVKPADYPQELFNRMFEGKFEEPPFHPTYVTTGDRIGDPDDKDDCETTSTYEPFYKVKTQQGEWRTVVQAPDVNYLQQVRVESCKNVGGSCFTDFKPPPGRETFCKQRYSAWEFLVHDGKDGTEKVKVDLPICCTCHYKI